jgi:hypothetical protein
MHVHKRRMMAEIRYGPITALRIDRKWMVRPGGRGMMSEQGQQLKNWFTHHPPQSPAEVAAYQGIRTGGRELAELIVDEVPEGVERDEALKCVRAAVMWSNAGIACGPKIGDQGVSSTA